MSFFNFFGIWVSEFNAVLMVIPLIYFLKNRVISDSISQFGITFCNTGQRYSLKGGKVLLFKKGHKRQVERSI